MALQIRPRPLRRGCIRRRQLRPPPPPHLLRRERIRPPPPRRCRRGPPKPRQRAQTPSAGIRDRPSHEEATDTVARLAVEARALRQAVPQKNPPSADSDESIFLEEMQHYSQQADDVVRHLDEHPEDLHADEILETDPDWSDFSEVLWKLKEQSYEVESAAAAIGARSCAAMTLRF